MDCPWSRHRRKGPVMSTPIKRIALPIHGAAAATVSSPRTLGLGRRVASRSVVVTSGTDLVAVDVTSGAVRTVATGLARPSGVAVDPRGKTAYVVDALGRRYAIYAVSLAAPARRRVVISGTGLPGQLALAGTSLAFVDATTGTLVSVDLITGITTKSVEGSDRWAVWPSAPTAPASIRRVRNRTMALDRPG